MVALVALLLLRGTGACDTTVKMNTDMAIIYDNGDSKVLLRGEGM